MRFQPSVLLLFTLSVASLGLAVGQVRATTSAERFREFDAFAYDDRELDEESSFDKPLLDLEDDFKDFVDYGGEELKARDSEFAVNDFEYDDGEIDEESASFDKPLLEVADDFKDFVDYGGDQLRGTDSQFTVNGLEYDDSELDEESSFDIPLLVVADDFKDFVDYDGEGRDYQQGGTRGDRQARRILKKQQQNKKKKKKGILAPASTKLILRK